MSSIDAVVEKKRQLDWLRRQVNSGEHIGAGLVLYVAIGPADDAQGCEIATCSNTEKILTLLIDSVEADIHLQEQLMRSELRNLKNYFGDPS